MKIFKISLCFGLIIAVVLSFARFDALCDDMRHNVFRLHIVANSDSNADQELKIKVRDAVLIASEQGFNDCESLEEAEKYVVLNMEYFKELAQGVIIANGYDYGVRVEVGDCYFENREYENFTLPAGNYKALNIIIGEGQGKNWWCVMFPAVCIGASAKLSDSVSKPGEQVAVNSEDYRIRFKIVEFYEEIKNFFRKL